jgi:multidrug transporter EmrE-like cation transporter
MSSKLLFLAVTVNAVIGQLLLRRGSHVLGGGPAGLSGLPRFLVNAAHSPWIYTSVAFQVLGYVLWMLLVSREKLGVATAVVGGGFYILIALSAWLIYGETLSTLQWVGIVVVTLGVACIGLGQA